MNKKKQKKVEPPKKVTWTVIYRDFKRRHPNLAKMIMDWRPMGYATIQIWLKDGSLMSYDYDEHMAKFIRIGKGD